MNVTEFAAMVQALAAIALAIFAAKSWQTAKESVKATQSMEKLALAAEKRNRPRIRANNPRQVSPARFRFDVYNDGMAGTGLREVSVEVKAGKSQDSPAIREFPLRLLDFRMGDKAAVEPDHFVVDPNVGASELQRFLGEIQEPDVRLLSDLNHGLILHITPVRGDRAGIWVNDRTI